MHRPLPVYLFLIALLMGFTVPMPAYSYTLTDGVHDRSNDPAFLASSIPGICAECHVPHGAFEVRLWGRDLGGAAEVDDLCVDCHDGDGVPAWASSAQNVANVKNSYHDFSNNTDIAPRGSCSACHELHAPNENTAAYVGTFFTSANLWIRDLTGEITDLDQQRDLGSSTPPNYLIGATVLCYDCHAGDPANNGPGATDFGLDPLPQDIAFGGDGSDGDSRGTVLVGGEIAGYYELPDGSEPDGGVTTPDIAEVQAGAVPGGHFVKSKMGGGTVTNYSVNDPDSNLLYEISVGDKLPCDLCHDPHAGYDSSGDASSGEDEVFFRRQIYTGEDQLLDRNTESEFDDLRASPASRNNSGGTGRYMCIYCHGTSDWDGNVSPIAGLAPLLTSTSPKRSVYGMKTMVGNASTVDASKAFPPPLGPPEHTEGSVVPCTGCHQHNNINASCGGCHDFPPTTGAHAAHASTANAKPGFNCETCHGPNPGSASWHNQSAASSYSYTNPTHYNNITLMPELNGQRGSEQAYYDTTWTRSGQSNTPSITKGTGFDFTCTNVYCHGMDTVNWTWQTSTGSGSNGPVAVEGYRLCGGCHGAVTDIDGGGPDWDHTGDGEIDVASFRSRGNTLYQASSAAANYEQPISNWGRGGHGDSMITSAYPSWFDDSASNSEIPLACSRCHDSTAPHFGMTSGSNPYRLVQTPYGGDDGNQTGITNLCTQSNCHPKTSTTTSTGDYAYLEGVKHPNDYFNHPSQGFKTITVPDTGQALYIPATGDSTSPGYDPSNQDHHIDRYLDHWGYWGGTSNDTTNNTADNLGFLPLGDSLSKSYGNVYDNTTAVRITCITCHNPHGTDLNVSGKSPFLDPLNEKMIPDNQMLRLRDQDSEQCEGCH